jgi:hypothetical protein
MLEAVSTPVPWCDREGYVNEKSSDTIGNRTRVLPVCSAVSQPLPHRVPPHKIQSVPQFVAQNSDVVTQKLEKLQYCDIHITNCNIQIAWPEYI